MLGNKITSIVTQNSIKALIDKFWSTSITLHGEVEIKMSKNKKFDRPKRDDPKCVVFCAILTWGERIFAVITNNRRTPIILGKKIDNKPPAVVLYTHPDYSSLPRPLVAPAGSKDQGPGPGPESAEGSLALPNPVRLCDLPQSARVAALQSKDFWIQFR